MIMTRSKAIEVMSISRYPLTSVDLNEINNIVSSYSISRYSDDFNEMSNILSNYSRICSSVRFSRLESSYSRASEPVA